MSRLPAGANPSSNFAASCRSRRQGLFSFVSRAQRTARRLGWRRLDGLCRGGGHRGGAWSFAVGIVPSPRRPKKLSPPCSAQISSPWPSSSLPWEIAVFRRSVTPSEVRQARSQGVRSGRASTVIGVISAARAARNTRTRTARSGWPSRIRLSHPTRKNPYDESAHSGRRAPLPALPRALLRDPALASAVAPIFHEGPGRPPRRAMRPRVAARTGMGNRATMGDDSPLGWGADRS